MKSFTIYKLEDEVSERLEQLAQSGGCSINQTAKQLLKSALGCDDKQVTDNRHEYEDLFGTWSEEMYQEFEKARSTFSEIDAADWA